MAQQNYELHEDPNKREGRNTGLLALGWITLAVLLVAAYFIFGPSIKSAWQTWQADAKEAPSASESPSTGSFSGGSRSDDNNIVPAPKDTPAPTPTAIPSYLWFIQDEDGTTQQTTPPEGMDCRQASKATSSGKVTQVTFHCEADASPTEVSTVNKQQLVAESVDAAMAQAGFSGTADQEAATKANLTQVANVAVTDLQAAGVDMTDEDVQNEFVGALVDRAIQNGLFCWASNLGPENEIMGAGVQRRELSTEGLMHVDHYNDPSLPSVSILVRAGEAAVVAGYGSMFEFPFDRCGGYNFEADATRYAENRREWGHAGVVFCTLWDALNGAPPCVNLWALSDSQIDELRPRLWDENPQNLAAVRAVTGVEVDEREEACGPAQVVPHVPVHEVPWEVEGPAVVSFWSNWPEMQTPQGVEYKLLVPEGASVSLRGGGTAWIFDSGCGDVAQSQYNENGLTPLDDSRYVQ